VLLPSCPCHLPAPKQTPLLSDLWLWVERSCGLEAAQHVFMTERKQCIQLGGSAILQLWRSPITIWGGGKNKKPRDLSPRANYTDRATSVCQQNYCQLLMIVGVAWSAQHIPMAVFSVF
jgi:hypothetical protein